jgi:hypothetical protein
MPANGKIHAQRKSFLLSVEKLSQVMESDAKKLAKLGKIRQN